MKLIVGLGNPGKKYAKTRHNIGFMAVDALAKDFGLSWRENTKLKSAVAKNHEIILIKPQTFMNNSGLAIKLAKSKFTVLPNNILVVMDDLDMAIGKIRYREEGSSGGHQGMQSIINYLGTDQIPRIKIGIGRSPEKEPDEYVTTNLSLPQLKTIQAAIPAVLELIQNKFIIPKK